MRHLRPVPEQPTSLAGTADEAMTAAERVIDYSLKFRVRVSEIADEAIEQLGHDHPITIHLIAALRGEA